MLDSIVKYVLGKVRLIGNTDGTQIGNVADRLKVDTTISAISIGAVNAYSNKLRYIDMNASTNGIARNTAVTNATWVTVYKYTGSGVIVGFILNLEEKNNWQIRLIVDTTEEIFDTNGLITSELNSNNIYDVFKGDHDETSLGPYMHGGSAFSWRGPLSTPISYSTEIEVRIKRTAGDNNKKFQAGLMILTKDT